MTACGAWKDYHSRSHIESGFLGARLIDDDKSAFRCHAYICTLCQEMQILWMSPPDDQ